MLDQAQRLASMTQLWRIVVRHRDRTPPFDVHPPYELRALTEQLALDQLASWRPDLEPLRIERMKTPQAFPLVP
jgi:hypothetical protein